MNNAINGIEYVPVTDARPRVAGSRAVIVVDRGWIFAGDVTRENGRIKLERPVWVFCWEVIGFDGVIANPKSKHAQIRQMNNVIDIPEGSEIFCIPVDESWGLL